MGEGGGGRLQTHAHRQPNLSPLECEFSDLRLQMAHLQRRQGSNNNLSEEYISASKTAASLGISHSPAEIRQGDSYIVVCMNSCVSEGCCRGEKPNRKPDTRLRLITWRFTGSDLHFPGVFGRSCPFLGVPVMFHDTQHPDSFLRLAKKAQRLIQGSSKTCKLSISYCKSESSLHLPSLNPGSFFLAPPLSSILPDLVSKNGLTLPLFSQGPLTARQGQAGPLSQGSCILSHLPFVFGPNLNFKLSPFN